jgi:hypothetical protein
MSSSTGGANSALVDSAGEFSTGSVVAGAAGAPSTDVAPEGVLSAVLTVLAVLSPEQADASSMNDKPTAVARGARNLMGKP